MKVSVITVVYNGEEYIAAAIESVISQDYPNIEYIVVDGNSTDKTAEIIAGYSNHISKVISESDKGIYDAMNKGLAQSTGDVIGILNSDDFYESNQTISKVVSCFQKEKVDSVYGDLTYVDPQHTSKVKRYWKSGEYKRSKFLFGWMPPHPAFFVKKEIYEKYGYFHIGLKLSADYEFMLRTLYKQRISVAYIPEVLTVMREGGNSNATFKDRMECNREDKMAWRMVEMKPLWITVLLKPLRKISQFFKTPHS